MGSAAATGDRLCQMEAMDGAARCLEALRLQHKICNCRPLEFNTRLLEVAGSVGAKVTFALRLCCVYGAAYAQLSSFHLHSTFYVLMALLNAVPGTNRKVQALANLWLSRRRGTKGSSREISRGNGGRFGATMRRL